jgi:hypothetical protein
MPSKPDLAANPTLYVAADWVAALAADALEYAIEAFAADGTPDGATIENLLEIGAGRLTQLGEPLSPELRRRVESCACAAVTFTNITCNAISDAGAEGTQLADTIVTRADTVPTLRLHRLLRTAAQLCQRPPRL